MLGGWVLLNINARCFLLLKMSASRKCQSRSLKVLCHDMTGFKRSKLYMVKGYYLDVGFVWSKINDPRSWVNSMEQ